MILVGRQFVMQALRQSVKASRAVVLLIPLLALGSKSSSLRVQGVRYDLLSFEYFFFVSAY